MARWLGELGVPYQVVATKSDKLSKSRVKDALAVLARELGGLCPPLSFSALSGQGREELLALIKTRQRLLSPDLACPA